MRIISALYSFAIPVLFSWAACSLPSDPADDPRVGHSQETLASFNGIHINGIHINGIHINGIHINGIHINGIHINGIHINGIHINGASLNAQQKQDFETLYQYVVECALPAGQAVTLYDESDQPLTYHGSLGLAPEWYDGPLTAAGEEKVSACLAARSNGNGQPVLISLRGSGIAVSAQEEDVFRTYEGIFWADLFAENDADVYIRSCMVEGGGLSGRVCAQSDGCGFDFQGDCASVCTYDAVLGEYTSCGGATHLIHTWLHLSNRLISGDTVVTRIDEDGRVFGRGRNTYAQLALDPAQMDPVPSTMLLTQLGNDIAELYINQHGCARKQNGDVYCWGQNCWGQVGNDQTTNCTDNPDVQPDYQVSPVLIGTDASQISIGIDHSCGLRTDGLVFCWGHNDEGQLGIDKVSVQAKQPKPVVGLSSVVKLATNSSKARHTCAITASGSLSCWGWNQHGTVGDGTTLSRRKPVPVAVDEQGNPFGDVSEVCVGNYLTCARKADGSLWSWGSTGSSMARRPRPVTLDPARPALVAAPGGLGCGNSHVCVVTVESTVWCAGTNQFGQLGIDSGGQPVLQPVEVPLPGPASFVNPSRTHTCATLVDNTVWCWGSDPGTLNGKPPLFSPALTSTPQQIDNP
jgi:Regulator of chromosome condensation (RCC1) repeat